MVFTGVKGQGRDANQEVPPTTKIKTAGAILRSLLRLHSVVLRLVKSRNNVPFYLYHIIKLRFLKSSGVTIHMYLSSWCLMGTHDVNIKYIDLLNDRRYAPEAITGNLSPKARKSTDRTVIKRKK
jgi:hypothetical protein